MSPTANDVTPTRGSLFYPFILLAASLLLTSGWSLNQQWRQRTAGRQMQTQQADALAQAGAAEGRLQSLLTELLVLANSGNTDARAIINKYQVRMQAPVAPATAPAVAPAP